MAETKPLVAALKAELSEASILLTTLCAHFAEHGTVSATETGHRFVGPFGSADLSADADGITARVVCRDAAGLFVMKSSLAEHIVMFAKDQKPVLRWSGDGANARDIPYFRAMSVVRASDVVPGMRRVTLTGADIAHFERGGLHVRVLVPPRGRAPVWPSLAPDGRVDWPKGEDALTARVYSIRRIDTARREIDIDVVLHGASPGSVWARTAQAGDPVGLLGPGGGEVMPADWYLLAGDETALPPIARVVESLPAGARATVVIEIADASQEIPLRSAAEIDLTWLHRNGAAAGTTGLLETAVRALSWPEAAAPFVMIGCEHSAARSLRGHIRNERSLSRDRHLVAAYWRRGRAGDGARGED